VDPIYEDDLEDRLLLPTDTPYRRLDGHMSVLEDHQPTADAKLLDCAWTADRIKQFAESIEGLKSNAVAHRYYGPLAVWGAACDILYRWLTVLYVTRDHENWRAVLSTSFPHVVDPLRLVTALTAKVAAAVGTAGGNARAILDCGDAFRDVVCSLPTPPDAPRCCAAWGKAVTELQHLGFRASVVTTSEPTNGKPVAAPAAGIEAPQDRDQQIADLLKANRTITSLEIARRVKTSDSTVRRSTPWTEHQARKANHRREKTIRKRALTRGVLASKAGGDEDPSELAAEREVVAQQYLADVDPETSDDDEARYLDQASPEELLDYRQMSPAEQKHTVKTWLLYNV
jgi:hypothetical protein